jgi:LysR family hydrogen peroxide-inducible transcriptional activator
MRLPTTRQIQYFLALVEHEHFGRAAAASFVSQSAFSAAIRELETTLGIQLVDRTNRTVTVTAMGRRIADQGQRCIEALEELAEIAQGQREPLEGELRLGVIPTIAPFLLPELLPALRARFPKLRALLTEAQTVPLHEQLLSGELDVLLLALPFDLRATETLPLFEDRFLLAWRDGTALIDPERYALESMPAETVLLLAEGHCLRGHALEACRLRGTEKLSPVSATSLLTLIEMVDADLGITFLPEMAVGSGLLEHTRVRTRPLPGGNHRTIGLAWRKGSARAAEFALLGEFITAHARRGAAGAAATSSG